MSEHEQGHAAEDGAHAHEAEPATIGRALRQARESRGESLSDAAYALKLMPRQIEAMETGRFDLLPGPAFVRGFLRNYARYLGLDIEHMLASLGAPPSSQVNLAPVTNAQGAMPAAGGEFRLLKPVMVVAAVLLLMLSAGWYFDWFRIAEPDAQAPLVGAPPESEESLSPPSSPVAPVLPGAQSPSERFEPVPVEPPPVAFAQDGEVPEAEALGRESEAALPREGSGAFLAPEPLAGPDSASQDAVGEEAESDSEKSVEEAASGNETVAGDAPEGLSRLVFRVEGESWIQVRDASGATIFTGTEQPGTTRTVDGEAPLSIVIGNAGRVGLERDGESVDLAPHTRSGGVARLELQ